MSDPEDATEIEPAGAEDSVGEKTVAEGRRARAEPRTWSRPSERLATAANPKVALG